VATKHCSASIALSTTSEDQDEEPQKQLSSIEEKDLNQLSMEKIIKARSVQ
jgi:hypothetical protein